MNRFYKIKFFEVRKMELEEIIDYMTDILDYSKYLKKIEEIKKSREYEILALRIKEIAIKKKREGPRCFSESPTGSF